MTTNDYATYIAGLPKVLAGAACIFRDAQGRVLIVEPNYREGWTLPGGTIESSDGETPRQAARRESAEEIGLDLEPGRLLAVDWTRGSARPPIVAYVYDGGVLDEEQLKAVRLQEEELLSWKLVAPPELGTYLPGGLGRRVGAALGVLESGAGAAELEDGSPVA
ncbi:NUDIX hydrolase [Streptomyces sp. NBC_00876]|uniref:NUDIX domain-containing protein n=1 Tax=Streptomyces sp. NBC_00876 TaxID=2975853 RepID=UPI003863E7EA|nr:NUDIX hydrolase [Streptomyces sp. NBC_00876]